MDDLIEIYVDVLNQTYYADATARHIRGNLYQIVSENTDPETDQWEFSTGDKVRCIRRKFDDVDKVQLVAYAKVEDDTAKVEDAAAKVEDEA